MTDEQIQDFVYLSDGELQESDQDSDQEDTYRLNSTQGGAEEQGTLQLSQTDMAQNPNDISSISAKSNPAVLDKIEYLRNVYLKYLHLKYEDAKKRKPNTPVPPETEHYMRTIEQVLMAELAFSFEQQQKVEGMMPPLPQRKKNVKELFAKVIKKKQQPLLK